MRSCFVVWLGPSTLLFSGAASASSSGPARERVKPRVAVIAVEGRLRECLTIESSPGWRPRATRPHDGSHCASLRGVLRRNPMSIPRQRDKGVANDVHLNQCALTRSAAGNTVREEKKLQIGRVEGANTRS